MSLNPILTKIYFNQQREYLKSKLLQIKPVVDSNCPECYYFVKNRFSKTRKNHLNFFNSDDDEKKTKYNSRDKKFKTKYRPLFKYEHNFLTYAKKKEMINVAIENINIYNRLNAKKGSYTLKTQLRDYERAQYYKKNHCKFPSIDFYRTSKSINGNLCPISNYCTFNNYKTINEKFMNEYLKKTNNQILHKSKSAREIVNSDKNKKIKLVKISKFKIKTNLEHIKINGKNNNKYKKLDNSDKSGNNLSKKYEKEKNTKNEEINKNISDNKEGNDVEKNYKELNINNEKENEISKKEEEKVNKDKDDVNIHIENNDYNKDDNNNSNYINSKDKKKEESEKKDIEENLLKQDSNKINQEENKPESKKESNQNKDSYLIYDEDEIEENINNNNNDKIE